MIKKTYRLWVVKFYCINPEILETFKKDLKLEDNGSGYFTAMVIAPDLHLVAELFNLVDVKSVMSKKIVIVERG